MYLLSFFQNFIIINLLLNLEFLYQSVHAVLVPLPLCFSSSDLLFLGTGPALYFNYLVVCICAILIPTLGYSIVCLISNFENNKQGISSQNNLILSLSNVASASTYAEIHSYILAACNLILVISIPIAVKIGLRTLNKAYSSQLMFYYPQSLALLIKLERPADCTEEEVKKVINEWYHVQMKIAQKPISDQQAKIVEKVYFYFDMQAYGVLTQQLLQIQKQKNKYDEQYNMYFESNNIQMGKDSKRSFSSRPSQRSLAAKYHRIDQLKQKIKNRQLQKTNKLIVVLKKIEHVQLLRTKLNIICKKNINKLVFPADNNASVGYAPFPSQIRFDPLHMSSTDKFRRRVMSWVGTGVLAGIGFAIQYLCLFFTTKYLWDTAPQVCPVILTFICYSVSALITVISNKLVQYELHSTKTNEDNSKCYHSLAISLFLKCISVFGIFFAHDTIIFSNSTYFAQTVTWLILIWSIFITVSKFINFSIIYYCFKIICLSPNFQDKNVSQAQINAKFDKPENKLYENYSEYCSFIFASFSFASIAPLCLITSSIFLIICILAERIAFLRIYRQPSPSNHSLFVLMGSILWKSSIGLVLGHFYLIYFIQSQEINVSSLVKTVLSIILSLNCVLLFVPSRILQPEIEGNLSYQKIENKLLNCYNDFNPIYSVNFSFQPQKEIVHQVSKSERLVEELNTMSKSLQQTLRDKLFNQKNPCLEVLNNREEDSLYFQFDPKVSMPEKKPAKSKVPPIFKQNRADVQFRMINRRTRKNTENLVKLTNLVGSQEQDEIKKRIKTAIKDSINKIN